MKDQNTILNNEISLLLKKHKKLIYKVVSSYSYDINEQEDLIQEIIYQIIKGYKKFDHKVKVTTWMYRVAFNIVISNNRKLNTRKKHFAIMPDNLISIEEENEVNMDEKVQQLRQFVKEFNPLNKAILIMYLDGNSHLEISEAMGISVTNVGTKISRIKQQLKNKFKQ